MKYRTIFSGTAWRVATTAFKEFWIPLMLAAGLTFWGVSGENFRQIQGYFFGFLMLAWFTGPIVRIKREIERKDSTKATIERLSVLSEKLDNQLRMISGHATGGDSYIVIHPHVHKVSGDLNIAATVKGDFPVRSVDILMQDLGAELPWTTAQNDYEDIIWPGVLREQCRWKAKEQNKYHCLIQFSALNSSTMCEAVVDQDINRKFIVANRQRVNEEQWVYDIPKNFPGWDSTNPELLFKYK